jgi:hypothetical protein
MTPSIEDAEIYDLWCTWEWLHEFHLIPYGIPKETYVDFLFNQYYPDMPQREIR